MTEKDFREILNDRIEKIQTTFGKKFKEYLRDNEVLHNFKEGSKISGKTMLNVLDGYMLKHYISYRDMLKDSTEGKKFTEAYINEKMGDIINYFIIAEAILLSEHQETEIKMFSSLDQNPIEFFPKDESHSIKLPHWESHSEQGEIRFNYRKAEENSKK